jgi:hypothetical protein
MGSLINVSLRNESFDNPGKIKVEGSPNSLASLGARHKVRARTSSLAKGTVKSLAV